MLSFVSCHPYFNTLYNAEEAYQTARRGHTKQMRVFPDSLVVTPSGAVEAQYARAIEKSMKMMEVYPRDTKRHDKAHFLMGKASFYKKDFPVAVGRMRDLQQAFPGSPLVPPSQVYVAKAHIMMDNLAIAEELLLKLMSDHPQLDKNQEITMLLVEIAMRRGGRSQALEILEGLNRSSLPLDRRIDVILRMADLNYELRQYQKALNLLRAAPRSKKYPYLMYRIDRSIYFCLDAMDLLDDALSHVTAMHRNRRYADQKYEIFYYWALTLRRMGRVDEAIALFDEIKRMCERGAGKSDTLSLCGRTSYELALIYQERGEFDKASAEFGAASKFPGLSALAKASGRLWALNRLKELRKPDSSGAVPAAARYSIAELFRFELETPDSAYIYYLELAADTAAADSLRPRALLSAAVVARHQMGDAARADSLLRLVAGEYDGTEYARRAQIEMDVEVTVVTARDRAERDFRAAEALLENDAIAAVKAFYDVYKQYPELDMAPKSLYAAAWNTENILQKNRAAMTLYEELCEKYPKSEQCARSAAPRLSVARDSIEVRKKRREAAAADSTGGADPADHLIDNDASPGAGTDKVVDPGIDTGTGADAGKGGDTGINTDAGTGTGKDKGADAGAAPSGP